MSERPKLPSAPHNASQIFDEIASTVTATDVSLPGNLTPKKAKIDTNGMDKVLKTMTGNHYSQNGI